MALRRLSVGLGIVAAGCVVAGMAAPSVVASAAVADRSVCDVAAPGSAACRAHVAVDVRTGAPRATVSYSTGFTPAQLTRVYGPFGSGAPLVAVVDAYAHPNAAADLAVYRTKFGLGTANLTQLSQTGGAITTVAPNASWGQEEMLDLDMVSAICPQCAILYVGASSASYTDLATAVTTAKNAGAAVISNSYGGPEFSGEAQLTAWTIPGVAVTVASGDAGYGVEFPAASAGVVAVGGTTLKINATTGLRASETAWVGAGSGCSKYVAKPAWQKDTQCARRTVADVSAVADPATGVAVYDSYGSTGGANWFVFGGTSVATPIVGAIYARDGIPAAPATAATTLYANAGALFDPTSGKNGICTTRTSTAAAYLCTAVKGYDGPTGNGTPNGQPTPF